MSDDLIKSSAREIRALLKSKAVSSAELLDVLEARIAKIDPIVNALPTLCFDRARQAIAARNHQDTALLGMPIAIKDLLPVAGVRTTWGSMLHEHHIPEKSDLLVERLESSGLWSTPSQTPPNSVPVPIRLTTYSASPETRGTQRCLVLARPEDRQSRSRRAWHGLPVVQIWAGRCETLPAFVASWDLDPALAGSQPTRATWRFIGSA